MTMGHEVFALLDDARPEGGEGEPRSRLYTGHAGTLACDDLGGWQALLAQLEQALARGLYAVPLLSYELGEHLLGIVPRALERPLAQVLLFEQCEHLATQQVKAWLDTRATPDVPAGVANIQPSVDEAEFARAIARIRAYIAAGDTYQVNYTYRLRFDAFGALPALYARLRERQPVPYGALVALPDGGAVLSFSPELFVRHEAGALLARPMKGTARASGDPQVDQQRGSALAADPKNRAENLMIVDLLRNDLGRVAETGSVEVPALFDVTRYGDVLQMTSTVRARLRADARLADVFAALYPCGSITGAPKVRTMQIIRELESAPRGLYTGAIGWIDPPAQGHALGDFCLSVPIRTLSLEAPAGGVRRGELGVGAGIVFDSDAASEYAECRLKAGFLTGLPNEFEVFETIRASYEDGPAPPGRAPRAHRRLVPGLRFRVRRRGGARAGGGRLPCARPRPASRAPCRGQERRAGANGTAHRNAGGAGAPAAGRDTDAIGRPVPAPQDQRAQPLRCGMARGRSAGSVRCPVLQRARRADRRWPQQCVRAHRRPLDHAAAVLWPAAGRGACGDPWRARMEGDRARHHPRHARARGGHRGVQRAARSAARPARYVGISLTRRRSTRAVAVHRLR